MTVGFTTFLVFLLLLHCGPGSASSRFAERLLETALGARIASIGFGSSSPAWLAVRMPRT